MNNLVAEHAGPDKRSFALPSLAEDDVEERSQMDTTFFTHDVRIGAVGYVTNPPEYARMVVIEVSELIAIKKSF